jgi:hypothetical protein
MGGYDRKQPFMTSGYGNHDPVSMADAMGWDFADKFQAGFRYTILAINVYMITLLKTYHFTVGNHNCDLELSTFLETTGSVSIEF